MDRITSILSDIRPETDFATSADFAAQGLLDSFDLLQLVAELERVYGIVIRGDDIIPENFSSIPAIFALVKRNGHPGGLQ